MVFANSIIYFRCSLLRVMVSHWFEDLTLFLVDVSFDPKVFAIF
jgi:hypothetical protein